MDPEVCQELLRGGFELSLERSLPLLPIRYDEAADRVDPAQEDGVVAIKSGGAFFLVALKSAADLFTGDARAPNLAGYPDSYSAFFATLEITAWNYCTVTGRVPSDDEFIRIYKQLKNKPDGRDRSPLFSYLQGAARLYMSLHDVSKHEFRAVVGQMLRSAKNFRMDKRSRNYADHVLSEFADHEATAFAYS